MNLTMGAMVRPQKLHRPGISSFLPVGAAPLPFLLPGLLPPSAPPADGFLRFLPADAVAAGTMSVSAAAAAAMAFRPSYPAAAAALWSIGCGALMSGLLQFWLAM